MYTSMYSVFRKISGRIQKLHMPKQTNKQTNKLEKRGKKERYKSNKNSIKDTEGNR